MVTGIAFADGDGWDWTHRYTIKGRTIVSDRAFGNIAIDELGFRSNDREMTTRGADGSTRVWKRLCRTVKEDIQCTRLHYNLNP
jgi:hypothetical protein